MENKNIIDFSTFKDFVSLNESYTVYTEKEDSVVEKFKKMEEEFKQNGIYYARFQVRKDEFEVLIDKKKLMEVYPSFEKRAEFADLFAIVLRLGVFGIFTDQELQSLKEKAKQKVERAKLVILRNKIFEFYEIPMEQLGFEFIYNPRYTTAATDGSFIYYNPFFIRDISERGLVFLILHEILHGLFLHFLRVEGRDGTKWNKATDHEINLRLEEDLGFKIVDDPHLKMGCSDEAYAKMHAEKIYDILPEDEPTGPTGPTLPSGPTPPTGPTGPTGSQTGSGSGPMKTGPNGTGPTGPTGGQTGSGSGPMKTGPNGTGPTGPTGGQTGSGSGPVRTGPSGTGPMKTGPNGTGPSGGNRKVTGKIVSKNVDPKTGKVKSYNIQTSTGQIIEIDAKTVMKAQKRGPNESKGHFEFVESSLSFREFMQKMNEDFVLQARTKEFNIGDEIEGFTIEEPSKQPPTGSKKQPPSGPTPTTNPNIIRQKVNMKKSGSVGFGDVISPEQGQRLRDEEGIGEGGSAIKPIEKDWRAVIDKVIQVGRKNKQKTEGGDQAGGAVLAGLEEIQFAWKMKGKVDWRKALKRYIGFAISEEKTKIPRKKYLYKDEYRSYIKPYEGGLEQVVVAIDTSGSMIDIIPEMLKELNALLCETKLAGNIDVIYWDTVPYTDNIAKIKPPAQLKMAANMQDIQNKVAGGGGTKLMPTLSYINSNYKNIDLLIIMTDGGLFGEDIAEIRKLKVYKWMRKTIWLIYDNPDFKDIFKGLAKIAYVPSTTVE